MALPVAIENSTGITRDVSPSGTYFWTSGAYAPGQSIDFAMEFDMPGGRRIQRCQGTIVRVEQLAHMVGVAATITESTMDFV